MASLVALICLGAVAVAMAACVLRMALGPTPFDRIVALDCLALEFVGAILLLGVVWETSVFLSAVLVVSLLGFIATVSLAAFLEGSLVD